MEQALSESLDNETTEKVCKKGQGEACCKYLMMGPPGFVCGKLWPEMRLQIDTLGKHFRAKGDNCDGVPMKR